MCINFPSFYNNIVIIVIVAIIYCDMNRENKNLKLHTHKNKQTQLFIKFNIIHTGKALQSIIFFFMKSEFNFQSQIKTNLFEIIIVKGNT